MDSHAASVVAAKPLAASDFHQYMVASRLEISQILHTIMRQRALITAASGGDDFFITTILAVDDEEGCLLLECAPHSENNERALKRQRLACSTTLGKVPIQFSCEHLEAVVHFGRHVFKIPLPAEMLRLQRRENYRIATSISAPVKCTIVALSGKAPSTYHLNLRDISCGGLAVISAPDIFTPELGAQYSCIVDLPGSTGLKTGIETRNTYKLTLNNGKVTQCSGFEFFKLQESVLAAIQRYIMRLECERRTLDS